LSLFSLSASCSGLLWFGLLAGLVGSLVLHFRGSNNSGNRKKKHLTVSLFGIHCEFKGRLSDRNNKEARSGSADVNAAAATSASATTTNATKKDTKTARDSIGCEGEEKRGLLVATRGGNNGPRAIESLRPLCVLWPPFRFGLASRPVQTSQTK